ncbi:MAG: S8 family serine peptidase, partial [Candidatus Limnocylindrales bacterium]
MSRTYPSRRSWPLLALSRMLLVAAAILAPVAALSADLTSTTTPDSGSGPTLPYIVTFVSGTSSDAQTAALAAAGAIDVDSIPVLRMHATAFPADTADAVVTALLADPTVLRVEADTSRTAEATPSDTSYGSQWSLPQIGWDQAFGTIAPSGSATVAILDTGIDASHPDLAGQVLPGTSILDGSNGMTDANGHGTWMAGIIAAQTDNALGIAGVGYAGVRVMPVTVLGADGTGLDSDIIEGVVYAADHGASVILMAFSNPGYSASLQAAIDYAWSKGLVLVAATGNDGSSTP